MTELSRLNKKRGTIKAGLTVFSNHLKEISSKPELTQLEIVKLKDRLNNAEEIELQDNNILKNNLLKENNLKILIMKL